LFSPFLLLICTFTQLYCTVGRSYVGHLASLLYLLGYRYGTLDGRERRTIMGEAGVKWPFSHAHKNRVTRFFVAGALINPTVRAKKGQYSRTTIVLKEGGGGSESTSILWRVMIFTILYYRNAALDDDGGQETIMLATEIATKLILIFSRPNDIIETCVAATSHQPLRKSLLFTASAYSCTS
jgi:hypothetical protein